MMSQTRTKAFFSDQQSAAGQRGLQINNVQVKNNSSTNKGQVYHQKQFMQTMQNMGVASSTVGVIGENANHNHALAIHA